MNLLRPFTKEFPGGGQAVAVRAGPAVEPGDLAAALELPPPPALFVLSGGAGFMSGELADRLSSLFSAIGAFLAAGQVTVIDGGTESGVMALMGQALNQARTAPYIGVLPAHAEVEPGGPVGEEVLERHHSHFVLIESDEWGAEVEPMYRLAAHLAGPAPSLTLLVNGGQISLLDVEWNVRQKREIVVLAGSGRLADEIATAVHHPGQEVREQVAAVVRQGRLTLFDFTEPPAELVRLLRQRLTVS